MPTRGDSAHKASSNKEYVIGLARAFGGAIIFAFPLLMTMEMWWLGFYMDRLQLLIFVVLNSFVLIGLAHFTGFEQTVGLKDAVLDGFAAYAIGVLASAGMLAMFGVIAPEMTTDEIIGKVAVQAVPASIGAVVARKQLGGKTREQAAREGRAGYPGQLFLMLAGALFLAFNVAPTEEMMLIAFMMTPWHVIATVVVSVLLLHAFVYSVGFSGQEAIGAASPWRAFVKFSLAGYSIALLVSLYVLWAFGRTDGIALAHIANMMVVLGFPASLGAAAARLIV